MNRPTLDALPSIHDQGSLLEFIRRRLDRDGRLDNSLIPLPDQAPRAPGGISFATGALDGIISHHTHPADQETDRADEIAELIIRAAAEPTRQRLRELYDALNTDDVLTFIDPMCRALAAARPSTADVARIGTWLASTSPDRGPVKIGIALLGITGAPDGALLHYLGAHEEFTLYAAVAFTRSRADPEPDIYTLAQRVIGWGRIQCVVRLRSTTNPEIARWILLDGFRNSVMYEYLAYIAATTGDLAGALDDPVPDREVLTAAADIIEALISGGPVEDVDSYPAAPAVIARWLAHMDHRAETINDFNAIFNTREFCDDDDWTTRFEDGHWTVETRDAIRAHAAVLLEHPQWPGLVHEGLRSTDRVEFFRAVHAARTLGIDAFDQLLARIDTDPLGGPWLEAWQNADTTRAELLADRAAQVLDLDAIATGLSPETGLGPDFKLHEALQRTLEGLCHHPGVGTHLLMVALHSQAVRNRNGALRTLEAWGAANWNDQHREHLKALAASDPDDRVRARAAALV